jgi:hypothetical protein
MIIPFVEEFPTPVCRGLEKVSARYRREATANFWREKYRQSGASHKQWNGFATHPIHLPALQPMNRVNHGNTVRSSVRQSAGIRHNE